MPQPPTTLNHFDSLVQVIRDLRGPEGCPWDKEQTHQSLTPYAIEETYEMVEAVESGDDEHICEELGDVLFQVVLHAQLAEERNAFDIARVIESITSKIVRRHPHVFSDVKVNSSEEVLNNWQEIKKQEKALKPAKPKSSLETKISLPALQTADQIGEKTQKFGFDWTTAQDVLKHLKSEIQELEQALGSAVPDPREIEHEIGDILFSTAQLARHLRVEPETSLRKTNLRFKKRFGVMLELAGGEDALTAASPEQKEIWWQEAKRRENQLK